MSEGRLDDVKMLTAEVESAIQRGAPRTHEGHKDIMGKLDGLISAATVLRKETLDSRPSTIRSVAGSRRLSAFTQENGKVGVKLDHGSSSPGYFSFSQAEAIALADAIMCHLGGSTVGLPENVGEPVRQVEVAAALWALRDEVLRLCGETVAEGRGLREVMDTVHEIAEAARKPTPELAAMRPREER